MDIILEDLFCNISSGQQVCIWIGHVTPEFSRSPWQCTYSNCFSLMDMKAKGKLFAVKSNDIKTETYYSWRVGTLVLCHTKYGCTMYDFHNSTDTLKFWTENGLLKNFFVFDPNLMKLGEIVVHVDNYNFTTFHQNQMKNKKVLLIAWFSVQNFKVPIESWSSYIVNCIDDIKIRNKPVYGLDWL